MNPAEIRELLSQTDNFYYEKEERFADKRDRPKKQKPKKKRRSKPEWKK